MDIAVPGQYILGEAHVIAGGRHLKCASDTVDWVACSDINALKDATLRRIDEVINQDVEMQASCIHCI